MSLNTLDIAREPPVGSAAVRTVVAGWAISTAAAHVPAVPVAPALITHDGNWDEFRAPQ